MKKVFLLMFVLLTLTPLLSKAQSKELPEEVNKWEFYGYQYDVPESEDKLMSLKRLVKEKYVVKEEIVSGDPQQRTVIKKPGIYDAVNKIEKYLKKEVKNQSISADEADKKLEFVMNVALAAINSSTATSFEMFLYKNRKNVDEQIVLFDKVKLVIL